MLVANPRDPSNIAHRVFASAWSESHSINAIMGGVRVALLMDPPQSQPSQVRAVPDGPVMIWWLKSGSESAELDCLRTSYEELARVAGQLRARVLLARPDAGEVADAALAAMGYSREIRGQVLGYWSAPGCDVPPDPPGYLPTGAVLSRHPGHARVGPVVLSLVPVDGEWRPQSMEATNVYTFSLGLARGESWSFAHEGSEGRWPQVEIMHMAPPIPGRDIEAAYGVMAARRADADRDYVQFHVAEYRPTP